MLFQKTIREELIFEGRGLHTGEHASMRLRPAPKDSGVVFYRSDKGAYIGASIHSISDTAFAMTLGSNGTRIKTVEHILAAVSGLGIDNLIIEVDGPEIPILDGSSLGFVEKMLEAGAVRQSSRRVYARVIKPVVFKNGKSEIAAFPYDGRKFTCRIQFDHKFLGTQELSLELEAESFARELATARTFGFLENVESLRAAGLAKGGSLDNAVILGDDGVLNASGLRFEDEFVRHKMLDFIGDLSLMGFPIYGHVVASRSGHSANLGFVRKFLDSPDCWEIASEANQPLSAAVPS